jgi:transcriptional regulator with XRE-family HTH domain
MQGLRAKPAHIGQQRAVQLRHRFGGELRLARLTAGLTQRQLGRLAKVSQGFVSSVERGHRAASLAVCARMAAACGHQLAVRLYPSRSIPLRDSGQLALVESITARAATSWHARMEFPIGSGDLRAADLVLEGAREVIHIEVERSLVDLQAQLRAAQLKREALAQRFDRPVRLVIAVPDRRSARNLVRALVVAGSRALPISSRTIWQAIRDGSTLGADGFLFVPLPSIAVHKPTL